jgi:1,4-dihydroxy-2-naphthoate polyprenyltransferase
MIRIVSGDDPLVKEVLFDFRKRENEKNFLVRMKGEGKFISSAFPEYRNNSKVLLEFIPEKECHLPPFYFRWLLALRIPYLSFSFFPLLLVTGIVWKSGQTVPMALLFFLYSSLFFVHLSCNLWGEYEDHLRGVDTLENSGGSGVIQRLWIPAVHIRNTAAFFMGIGILLGGFLFLNLPSDLPLEKLMIVGALGALGAASYSGWPFHYKYFGLGEPIVFLLSGPILTLGASYLLFGNHTQEWKVLIDSLPLSFLAILRLHAGNLQKIPFDTMASVFTISRLVGFRIGKYLVKFLLIMPFALIFSLWLMDYIPMAALGAFVAFPFLIQSWNALDKAKGPLDPFCAEVKLAITRMQWTMGAIYSLSFFLS